LQWVNELKTRDGAFVPHFVPLDQTLHWANPAGGQLGRDTSPCMDACTLVGQNATDGMAIYDCSVAQNSPACVNASASLYEGPVPNIAHVHGTKRVGDESDG
jgi:hypothetical protein